MSELNWDDPDYQEPVRSSYNDKPYRQYEDRDDYGQRGKRGGGSGGGGYQGRRSYDKPKESRYDNSSGNRGYRSKQFNDTIDVDSACFGMVIGRGGSNVQRLQNDYNVNVQLDKNRGSCTVSGDVEDDVKSAIDDIQRHMDKAGDRQSSDRYGGSGRDRHQRDNTRNDFYSSGGRSNYRQMDEEPKQTSFYGSEQNADNDEYSGPIDWDALNIKAEAERKARWAKCPPLTKNFYNEHPEVTQLTKEQVAEIRRENNNITVSRVFKPSEGQTEDIPKPVFKFEHCFAAYPDLLEEIYKQNFERPSPIQSQAWPVLLKGEDMIGIAQTGTGKTLAFLLPAMIHTEYQSIPRRERKGPNVLIMAPTRELALQIEKEVNKYSFRGMKAVCVYGGGNRNEQISNVEEGVEIIICTPGRLNDLIQAKVIEVSSITYLVLDEADRMLDMGFEPQIRKVLLDIRPDRQTIMTSATWPPGVRRLAQSYMENPIQVCVGSLDLAATHSVRQVVEIMDDCDKVHVVRRFIQEMQPDDKIIIFCGKKVRADDLSSDLCLDGISCQCIHGSRDQRDREQAIADITSGEVRILIATDVASRGLDIEDVTHVINFDFPRNIEEYVHRVGRTGRAGRTGTSISYITRDDWGVASDLINILEEANQEVPSELRDMAKRFTAMKERRNNEYDKAGLGRRGGRGGGGGGGGYRSNRY